MRAPESVYILVAEDDDDDFFLMERVFEGLGIGKQIVRVENGRDLLDYLRREGRYAGSDHPIPGLVLLDLNMPRMCGREALRALKSDERLKTLPVVVLTTSGDEEDRLHAYASGACSYVRKPFSRRELTEKLTALSHYWLEVVELPEHG